MRTFLILKILVKIKNEKKPARKVSERSRKMVDESVLFTLEQKRKIDIIKTINKGKKITVPLWKV